MEDVAPGLNIVELETRCLACMDKLESYMNGETSSIDFINPDELLPSFEFWMGVMKSYREEYETRKRISLEIQRHHAQLVSIDYIMSTSPSDDLEMARQLCMHLIEVARGEMQNRQHWEKTKSLMKLFNF